MITATLLSRRNNEQTHSIQTCCPPRSSSSALCTVANTFLCKYHTEERLAGPGWSSAPSQLAARKGCQWDAPLWGSDCRTLAKILRLLLQLLELSTMFGFCFLIPSHPLPHAHHGYSTHQGWHVILQEESFFQEFNGSARLMAFTWVMFSLYSVS